MYENIRGVIRGWLASLRENEKSDVPDTLMEYDSFLSTDFPSIYVRCFESPSYAVTKVPRLEIILAERAPERRGRERDSNDFPSIRRSCVPCPISVKREKIRNYDRGKSVAFRDLNNFNEIRPYDLSSPRDEITKLRCRGYS